MLRQFSNLTVEADGRYATDNELEFLENYFDSYEVRLSAYVKIRDSATEI